MSERKVYCRDCKYGSYCFSNDTWRWCELRNEYTGQRIGATEKKDKNFNGECKDYQRKWWKFWRSK